MRIIVMAVIVFATIAQNKIAQAQCGESANLCKCIDPPNLSIMSNTLVVSGRMVHLSVALPSEAKHWFYAVTCHTSSRLFNLSLWSIVKFSDRDGFYLARSWNLQVLDSEDAREKELIFDRENEFYFWGDVVNEPEGANIRLTSIVGLPEGIHGEVVLREIRRKEAERHTSR